MPVIESKLAARTECGQLSASDFVAGPNGAVASVAFPTALSAPYIVSLDILDPAGCTYGQPVFPVKGPAGFTVELGTSDLSTLSSVTWCATELL